MTSWDEAGGFMDRTRWRILVTACVVGAAAAAGCARDETAPDGTASAPAPVRAAGAAAAVRLEQGWSAQEAEEHYYAPQAPHLIRYGFVLAVEEGVGAGRRVVALVGVGMD